MTIDDRQPHAWSELTDTQCSVLHGAMDGSSLIDVLNSHASLADAPYWNRKEKYVAELSSAALFLLRAGLIEVWEEPVDRISDAGLIATDAAEYALTRPTNWWQYDPDGNWDPDEDMSRYAVYEQAPPVPFPKWTYLVVATERGRELKRDGGERRTRPDDRSPEVRERDAERQRISRRWAEISRAVVAGQGAGHRCPVNHDADLDIERHPAEDRPVVDPANPSAYRHTLTTVMTCPACGASHQIRHMARLPK